MEKTYLISGIDTGIGKTVATGLMARYLVMRGIDAITVKMVQTGNDGFSEDLDAHRALSGLPHFPEDDLGLTAPQIFKFPSSPLLAAELEGKTVDLKRIAEAVRTCSSKHAVTLVESAGGLDVPLTADTLTSDFVAEQGWPVILVTCGRLGAINHALLSLDAAKMREDAQYQGRRRRSQHPLLRRPTPRRRRAKRDTSPHETPWLPSRPRDNA